MMIKGKIKISETLFYTLGVFATIQLLSLAGITVFNILLMLIAVICFLLNSNCLKIDSYFVISMLATLLTVFLSVCNDSLSSEFKKRAVIGGIIYVLVLLVYLVMNTKTKYAEKIIRGFEFSCIVTLIWCFCNWDFYYAFHLDINTIVFSKIFGIAGAASDYHNGAIIPSGFYSHRAILMPSFIYMFFSTSNPYLMIVIILMGCLTRSTALIMGLVLAMLFKVGTFLVTSLYKKVRKKELIVVLSIIVITFAGIFICRSKISELVGYMLMRIADATSNKADNSSVVHFLYYKNLPVIIKKMNIVNVLFGTGFGTSGQHYVWFNGQYADMGAWVVESDYINILLSQGIVGIILWGYILTKIIILSIKYNYWENIAFVLIVAFVGIMYNIQFTWFIIIEFAFLLLTKREVRVFNSSFKGKRRI